VADPRDDLTRDEARERARLLTGVTYEIALDLSGGGDRFASRTLVRFDCAEPGASTFIDLTGARDVTAELNGERLGPEAIGEHRIALRDLRASNELRLTAAMPYSRVGTGMHRFTDPVDGSVYCYTDFEEAHAHEVYACFDQPDVKGRFTFDVTVPDGWVVVSNTAPQSSKANRWVFGRTPILPTYVTAVCAGPFHGVHDDYDGIPLGVWCRRSLAQHLDAENMFAVTKQGLEYFQRTFGYAYPFDTYDQVFVPEFNAGAMENAGCVTFAESMIFRGRVTRAAVESRAIVIMHEMAHMWFGDLVTMRWWDDLWLNESFAEFLGFDACSRATEFADAWTTFANTRKIAAVAQDQMPTTHPIVGDVPSVRQAHMNFDMISYAKGAAVLRQLAALIGEDGFLAGIRAYFAAHEWSNADLEAFLGSLSRASGRDLDGWAKEWLQEAGVNTISAEAETEGDVFTSFALLQAARPEQPTLRTHSLALGLYDLHDGRLALRERVPVEVSAERTEVPALLGRPVPDVLVINDGDLTYAKIRLDERTVATLRDHLAGLPDALTRTLCWSAATDQVRDAELPARSLVDLLLGNVHAETDPGLVTRLTRAVATAVVVYGAPSNRDAALRRIADRARAELGTQPDGSDLQLAWAHALILTARSDEHLGFLRAVLDGTEVVDGLAVDTTLRWAIVSRLAQSGAAGSEVIDAELERDPTDQGARAAIAARASRPAPEAKAQAWAVVMDSSATRRERLAAMSSFGPYEQADLVQPYVERYFEALERMWQQEPVEVSSSFAGTMYPSACASAGLIDRTTAYLAEHPTLAPPLRRALIEQQDQAERLLRGRALDAASE